MIYIYCNSIMIITYVFIYYKKMAKIVKLTKIVLLFVK